MATMLGFLTTDAHVPPAMLQRALHDCARDTFDEVVAAERAFAQYSHDHGLRAA